VSRSNDKGMHMSLSLVEALGQVELKPGRTYHCQVKGHWVTLRVAEGGQPVPSAGFDESDVMLDPWVEFPQPVPAFTVRSEFGPAPLPDVPVIPRDEDES
jgi:hypothetical protein